MKRLLMAFGLTSFLLLSPALQSPATAAEETPDQGDPNVVDRSSDCATSLRPEAVALCLAGAGVSEAAQETGDAVVGVASSAWDAFAASFVTSAMAFIYELSNWWIKQPSQINNDALVTVFQSQLAYLGWFMVVAGILWQSTRLIYSRKAEGLGIMLSASIKFAVVSAGGYFIVRELSSATDEWAASIVESNAVQLQQSGGLEVLLESNSTLAFFLAVLMILGGIMQTVLFVLRDLGLVIMTGFLVFAASGQYFEFSRPWLGRLIGPILAVLFYKPMAAIVMTIALGLVNSETLFGFVAGSAMVFLSAFMIKPFLTIFAAFTPDGVTPFGSGGGSGIGLASGAVGMGAVAVSSGMGSSGGGGASSSGSGAPDVQLSSSGTGPISQPSAAASGVGQSVGQEAAVSGATAAGGPVGVAVQAAQVGVQATRGAAEKMGDSMGGEENR